MLKLVNFEYPADFKARVIKDFQERGDFDEGLLEALDGGTARVGWYLAGKRVGDADPPSSDTILAAVQNELRDPTDPVRVLTWIHDYIHARNIRKALYDEWKSIWGSHWFPKLKQA